MTPSPIPGAYVLGMHRSGTSVVSGVVDRLGLDGGPRESMLVADQFNSDGYWEQTPLIEWHDEVLQYLGGWASAPPAPLDDAKRRETVERFSDGPDALVQRLYSRPWFMKDPRQCLLLWLWTDARPDHDLAVITIRRPEGVADSLRRRNRYPLALGHALWERYCHDLLEAIDGRPCIILRYEDLLADPTRWVTELAGALDRHLPTPPTGAFADHVDHAAELVRRNDGPPAPDDSLEPEQRALADLVGDLTGYHAAFRTPELPPLSARGLRTIQRRRRWLNLIRPIARNPTVKARLDRMPAVVRDLRRS